MKLEDLYEHFDEMEEDKQVEFVRRLRLVRNEDIQNVPDKKPSTRRASVASISDTDKELLKSLGISMSALKALQNLNSDTEENDDDGLFE